MGSFRLEIYPGSGTEWEWYLVDSILAGMAGTGRTCSRVSTLRELGYAQLDIGYVESLDSPRNNVNKSDHQVISTLDKNGT